MGPLNATSASSRDEYLNRGKVSASHQTTPCRRCYEQREMLHGGVMESKPDAMNKVTEEKKKGKK